MNTITTPLWGFLPVNSYCVSGVDARSFLQGQLTQDIKLIQIDTCQYAAYCNPKGRMLAMLLLYANTPDTIMMRLHQATAATVVKRLQVFVLRSQVKINQQSVRVLGINHSLVTQLCQEKALPLPDVFAALSIAEVTLTMLPNNYAELHIPTDSPQANKLLSEIQANYHQSNEGIEQLRLRGGHFHILPQTSETVLPQQTPLESWGGINYHKGCYVGQEVISRNKYLGKVNKVLATTTFAGDSPENSPGNSLEPTTTVYDDNGKVVGKVIECQYAEGKTVCLALIAKGQLAKPCRLHENLVTFTAIDSDCRD